MKVFCDTNVLIAGCIANHPHHNAARPVLERVKAGNDEGFIAAHSIAEAYAVLTRLPGASQVAPSMAWQLIAENILKDFEAITLTKGEYEKCVREAALLNAQGGKIYDALLLTAAVKSGARKVYTFNISHFQSLAPKDFVAQIVSP